MRFMYVNESMSKKKKKTYSPPYKHKITGSVHVSLILLPMYGGHELVSAIEREMNAR